MFNEEKRKKMTLRAKKLEKILSNTRHPKTINPSYQLEISVWLLEEAAWQGERVDIMSFDNLKDARLAQKIIAEFIAMQKRKRKEVQLSEEEEDFWDGHIGSRRFHMFYAVHGISKVTSKKSNKMEN